MRLVILLGLILVSWGLDDLRGFIAHPARAGLLGWALLGLTVVLVRGLDLQPFRRGKRSVGRQRWVLATAMVIALVLTFFLPYADRRGMLTFTNGDVLRYAGLIFVIIGDTVGMVALRTLGKQFSGYVTVQEDHQLVQRGIYGVIRHPIYLRVLLVMLGLPLVFRSWLVLPALGYAAVFVALRIRQEENLLTEHFGAEFEAYQRRTWRLLPYLY